MATPVFLPGEFHGQIRPQPPQARCSQPYRPSTPQACAPAVRAPDPAESRGAPPPPQDPSPLRGPQQVIIPSLESHVSTNQGPEHLHRPLTLHCLGTVACHRVGPACQPLWPHYRNGAHRGGPHWGPHSAHVAPQRTGRDTGAAVSGGEMLGAERGRRTGCVLEAEQKWVWESEEKR